MEQTTEEVVTPTRKQRNLAIKVAKDVLESIHGLAIQTGAYVYASTDLDGIKGSKAQAEYLSTNKRCRTCALGACLLSLVKLRNKFEFEISNDTYGDHSPYIGVSWETAQERLKEAFTPQQIQQIEDAFEVYRMGNIYPDLQATIRFGQAYSDDAERLTAIMQNIIDNDGIFTPVPRG